MLLNRDVSLHFCRDSSKKWVVCKKGSFSAFLECLTKELNLKFTYLKAVEKIDFFNQSVEHFSLNTLGALLPSLGPWPCLLIDSYFRITHNCMRVPSFILNCEFHL